MKVVLDTNVLLISLLKTSKYRPIFDALLNKKFDLAISHDIFQEYMEVIEQKTNPSIAKNVGELLLSLDNVKQIEVYYRWLLIDKDYDDNKFVDCAIAGNVKFVVSNDKDFKRDKVSYCRIDQF
ncbi:MAG: putative toxin-antitoxin system toxin component, PIN family [Bacteroidota bacterium]